MTTVFLPSADKVNVYRIPSLVATAKGTLIAAAEARKESWKDKSPTDISLKRSTDGGKTWSETQIIMAGGANAYMDPCLVSEEKSGKVFLFACYWPAKDHSAQSNRVLMSMSMNDGKSWTKPKDITELFTKASRLTYGFGPGSGLQMKGGKTAGRLIVPVRAQIMGEKTTPRNTVLYSDDAGGAWKVGGDIPYRGEFQIAEYPEGTLVANIRGKGGARWESMSKDGGLSWSKSKENPLLPYPAQGCQGSVLRLKDKLYYSGPEGLSERPKGFDTRSKLTLWQATGTASDGLTMAWQKPVVLHDKASGYSCMTLLPSGEIALIFEQGDTPQFTTEKNRPKDWMTLKLLKINPAKMNKK